MSRTRRTENEPPRMQKYLNVMNGVFIVVFDDDR